MDSDHQAVAHRSYEMIIPKKAMNRLDGGFGRMNNRTQRHILRTNEPLRDKPGLQGNPADRSNSRLRPRRPEPQAWDRSFLPEEV